MYSVLLIDDESWVMEDLKLLIDWEALGFTIIGGASNAEDAKMLIAEKKPDVVISDIRMPGLSGIQLLEEFEGSNNKFKTIFVTAYGKFEYAKRALELGAFGYLLKPVEPEELSKSLTKLKVTLDAESGLNEQIYKYEKTRVLYSLLDGYNTDEELNSKLIRIGVLDTEHRYVLAIIKSNTEITAESLGITGWNSVILPLSHSRYLLVVQSKNGNMNLVGYKNLLSIMQKVADKEDILFGISRIAQEARKFRSAFSQAETALATYFINKQHLNVYRDSSQRVKEVNAYIAGFKASHSVNELLNTLPDVLVEQKINIDNFEAVVTYLASQLGIEAAEVESDCKELINQFPDVETYFAYLYQCVNGSYKKGNGKTSSRYIIKEITDYIKYNYNEKLMINELAQKFFLNPSYLSGLFKEETGKPFTAYLVECRLKKAVELLENTDLSSSEISAQVGYEDYFHFSKLFKKHIGISPSNYRKSKKENKE